MKNTMISNTAKVLMITTLIISLMLTLMFGMTNVNNEAMVNSPEVTAMGEEILQRELANSATDPIAASDIVYGQKLRDSEITGAMVDALEPSTLVPGEFKWNSSESKPSAGTPSAMFTFTPTDSAAYLSYEGAVVINVAKAEPSVTLPNLNAIYGQRLSDIALPDGFSYVEDGETSVGAVGDREVELLFTPSDIANYNTKNVKAKMTVVKASFDTSRIAFDSKTFVYDGCVKSIAITGELPVGLSVEYIGNDVINSGIYEVTARFGGDANYNDVKALKARIIINQPILFMIDKVGTVQYSVTATYGISPLVSFNIDNKVVDKALVKSLKSYIEKDKSFDDVLGYFTINTKFETDGQPPTPTEYTYKIRIDEFKNNSVTVVGKDANGAYTKIPTTHDGAYVMFTTTLTGDFYVLGDGMPNYYWFLILIPIVLAGVALGLYALYRNDKKKKPINNIRL